MLSEVYQNDIFVANKRSNFPKNLQHISGILPLVYPHYHANVCLNIYNFSHIYENDD
ncbi:Uncharacterised protein [Actinobacillus lignieresii]|uniref:Uncharacterized protein n=1 Tax=Actinobacillus lignieresii TaxID=720 RepID=A0A380U408_ACTLI|nr:Uncharacterised protein [Actinobacillus lignieresii]SUU00162.1 Uncharacterised protein [Actinobacillus lignieresii]